SGDELVLSIVGSSDSLRVQNHFNATNYYRIEQIRFADGTTWNTAAISARVTVPPPAPNDTNPVLPGAPGVASRLLFRQVGNDLEISSLGSNVVTLVRDWYAAAQAHLDLATAGAGALAPGAALEGPELSATTNTDETTRLIYDARGKLVAELDAERYLTEHVYDARGNRTTTIRYS
ncbi:calcium-binding protein, partial [Methylibium rhizosphaerae]|uniref:calcium-binding protein n=1 Tax=Methylibium rhizosphaerae TaxID=2570323 RepID=UPI00112E1C1F